MDGSLNWFPEMNQTLMDRTVCKNDSHQSGLWLSVTLVNHGVSSEVLNQSIYAKQFHKTLLMSLAAALFDASCSIMSHSCACLIHVVLRRVKVIGAWTNFTTHTHSHRTNEDTQQVMSTGVNSHFFSLAPTEAAVSLNISERKRIHNFINS